MCSIIIKCSTCLFPTLFASIYWFSNASILRAGEIFAFKIKIVSFLKAIKTKIPCDEREKTCDTLAFKHPLLNTKASSAFERHVLIEGPLQAEPVVCQFHKYVLEIRRLLSNDGAEVDRTSKQGGDCQASCQHMALL